MQNVILNIRKMKDVSQTATLRLTEDTIHTFLDG